MANMWNEEHEEFIRENFRHKTYSELAEHFGVSQKAMESKIRRMGLKKQDYKDPDPIPTLPVQQLPELPAPTVGGPTPIRSASLLPRKHAPRESAAERAARLEAELEAAAAERERREAARSATPLAKALKAYESGLARLHDRNFGKALQDFRGVVDANPPDVRLVARARQYIDTIERRGRADSFVPQNADDHYLLAVMQLNDGDPGAALASLAKALKDAPGDDRVLYCQAAAHAQKGDIDAAIDALREAVDINEANRIYAQNDPDFIPLRVHEDFRSVVSGH